VQDLEENLNAVGETKASEFRTFNHFIMNLPATAIEFLGNKITCIIFAGFLNQLIDFHL